MHTSLYIVDRRGWKKCLKAVMALMLRVVIKVFRHINEFVGIVCETS